MREPRAVIFGKTTKRARREQLPVIHLYVEEVMKNSSLGDLAVDGNTKIGLRDLRSENEKNSN
jgi:hypothetical protein